MLHVKAGWGERPCSTAVKPHKPHTSCTKPDGAQLANVVACAVRRWLSTPCDGDARHVSSSPLVSVSRLDFCSGCGHVQASSCAAARAVPLERSLPGSPGRTTASTVCYRWRRRASCSRPHTACSSAALGTWCGCWTGGRFPAACPLLASPLCACVLVYLCGCFVVDVAHCDGRGAVHLPAHRTRLVVVVVWPLVCGLFGCWSHPYDPPPLRLSPLCHSAVLL